LHKALDQARAGDVIVVHTLDRLGRTVRDTLNLIHDLQEREVGVRTLADPIKVDSSNPDDPMAQLSVVILSLFGQMERTYAIERAAHARA
ncbi:recombinase family protein, partial [Bacteroides thetaiotaomicron]|uniref:recombinase family protein n=2 Tax=Bacteria TaxID=2 RepID=UPI001925814C